MPDEKNGDDESKESSIDKKIELVADKNTRHLLIIIILLLVIPILVVVCVLNLVQAVKTTDKLMANQPGNLTRIFSDNILSVQADLEIKYNKHLNKMDDSSIFVANKKFQILYTLSQESEADYGKMLTAYQNSIYTIASKVHGSGEWFFFFDGQLKKIIHNQSRRESQMIWYFSKK